MKTIVSLMIILSLTHGQQSGSAYYKSAVMNGNNIKTVFGNWGVIGQPGDARPRGAWLKETNGYIGDNSFFVGVEFPVRDYNNDGKPDTVHSVITCPVSRPASVFDTDDKSGGGKPFSFMPVDGFFNPNKQSVAMSNDPSTWPASWSNVWKGVNGNGEIVADLESYFQVDDQNDERFSVAANNPLGVVYKPDTLHPTKKGQGIRVDVRYLQFNNPLFNDILFRVYEITNESSYDYQKVFFGYLNGTLIGVTGTQDFNEYDDDYSIFYKKENVVIAGDFDNNNFRNPSWVGSVGKLGETFLETDTKDSIASYLYFTPANDIPLGLDDLLWITFKPGFYSVPRSIVNDTTVEFGQDGDYTIGSQYFLLKSKQKKRIVSAIAYGYSKNEIFQKIKLGKVLTKNKFDISSVISNSSIPQFENAQSLSGNVQIQWPGSDPSGTAELFCSPDAGTTWQLIAENIPNNGTYSWNTAQFIDCAFGKLRIFTKDAAGAYQSFRENKKYFSVNNSGNGTPFIKILSELNNTVTVTETTFPFKTLIGDPDDKNLTAKIFYSLGDKFVFAEEKQVLSDTTEQNITINMGEMPNGEKFRIKIEITDGFSSWSDSTEVFMKKTPRNNIAKSNITTISGTNQSKIGFAVVDKSQTTTDTYVVSFVDTGHNKPKEVSVFNQTKNRYSLHASELINKTESPVFDGLRVSIDDIITKLDTSYWNRKNIPQPNFNMMPLEMADTNNNMVYGYPQPIDYQIIYGVKGFTINLKPYLGYTTPAESVDVVVINKRTQARIEFFYTHYSSEYFEFYFVENILGKKRMTWYASISRSEINQAIPQNGDTITFITKKGISIYDSLLIKDVALGVSIQNLFPAEYSLSQNFPNPFNPTTTIRYSIPKSGIVILKVYDILGREVKTLVNDFKIPGSYSTEFDASKHSSGMYFYKLTSERFSETKKMMLIR